MNQPIVPSDLAISRNRIHATLPLRWDHPVFVVVCCGGFFCLFLAPRIIPKKKQRNKKTKLGNKNTPNLYRKTRKTTFFKNLRWSFFWSTVYFRSRKCLVCWVNCIFWKIFMRLFQLGAARNTIAGDFDIAGWMIRLGKNDTFAAVSFPRKILYILCYANGCMIVPACIHVLSMCNWQNLGPWD